MFDFLKKKVEEQGPFVVTKDSVIVDILNYDMGLANVLAESGMACVGCPASMGETLEEACIVHGIKVEDVLANINKYLAANNA
jgi:hybrid cluster-associated redox disulfide protein